MRLAIAIVIYLTFHFAFRHFITGGTRVLFDVAGVAVVSALLFVALLINETGIERPNSFRHPIHYAEKLRSTDNATDEYVPATPEMSRRYLLADKELRAGKLSFDKENLDFMTYIRTTFNVVYEDTGENVWPYHTASQTRGNMREQKNESFQLLNSNVKQEKAFSFLEGDYSELRHDFVIMPAVFLRKVAFLEYETGSGYNDWPDITNELYDTTFIDVHTRHTPGVHTQHY